jgi:hypothetical protein
VRGGASRRAGAAVARTAGLKARRRAADPGDVTRRPRRLLLLPLLLLLCALTPATAGARVAVGIADNKPTMFADPRYADLQFRQARIDVRWDVLTSKRATAALDRWMAGAKATGARPLVTFDKSPLHRSYNPTPAQLASTLKRLRLRYPGLREFSTWNEANAGKRPEMVARWWLALRRACPACTVLGADLLDRENAVPWARAFVRAAGRTPKVWGLHNYVDANRLTTRTTRRLLRSVGGAFWFTETGGIVHRNNGSTVRFPTGVARAAKVTRFIFDRLAALSPRMQRVYLYHWDGAGARTWDSAFVGPDGRPRPALTVLQGVLARAARR